MQLKQTVKSMIINEMKYTVIYGILYNFQLNKPLPQSLTECDKTECNVFYPVAFSSTTMLVFYVRDFLSSENQMRWRCQQLVCIHILVISPDI